MKLNIKLMKDEAAAEISKWTYEQPYSVYSLDESCTEELLNSFYFTVSDEEGNIIGYYCYGQSAQVPAGRAYGAYDEVDILDIGLGLKPGFCGKGLGFDFLKSGMEFGKWNSGTKAFRLTVAAFNLRAIKVYEKLGFKKVMSFKRVSEAGEMEFWVMIKR